MEFKIKKWIMNNVLIRAVYKVKFYIDVSIGQISWITGKFPEFMALVYFLDRADIILSINQIILLAIFTVIGFFIAGYILKNTGIWDVERYVDAAKNPVTNEMLTAARKINKGDYK